MADLLHTEQHLIAGMVDQWYAEDEKVHRVRTQLDRELILAQNQAVANDPHNLKAADGLRWALRIPEDDYAVLIKRYPELAARDRETNHKAWQKFMRSSEARPYLVRRPSKRGRSV